MDGAESVRSNRSERSHRSHGHHHSNHGSSSGYGNHRHNHHHHHHRHRSSRSSAGADPSSSRGGPDDRSVTIKMPASHEERGGGSVREQCPSVDGGGACDDNWGDDTTAVTGNTSETGWSAEDVRLTREVEQTVGFRCCSRRSGGAACIVASLLMALAYVSPIVMVVLPALRVVPFKCLPALPAVVLASTVGSGDYAAAAAGGGVGSHGTTASSVAEICGLSPQSEGMLIGFAVRLLALAAGVWALFCRHPQSSLPRLQGHRVLVLFVVLVLTLAYWLFYGYRALNVTAGGQSALSYDECVHYASSMVDALLFVHYAAVVLLELRHLQPAFCVKVLRSPDGQCRTYHVGRLSVQRAAAVCLERYYRDFAAYNPYLENVMRRRAVSHGGSSAGQGTKFKVYDVDGSGAAGMLAGGGGGGEGSQRSKAILAAEARRRDASHNERFYQESEYERRVHKRRARLVTAAEEAFTHVKRFKEEGGGTTPMDAQEAAQAIFPSMARSLQKYLRITRQQPWHTMESILDHLADCLQSDASARAFLEPYLAPGSAVVHNPKECIDGEQWSLTCDGHPRRAVAQGTQFTLRKGDVSLLCIVKRMPFFTLVEEPSQSEPKGSKFVLRLNSETSV